MINNDNRPDETADNTGQPPAKKPKSVYTDLPDNEHDEARMQNETVILDLPDVADIPGQEHIHVPRLREMEDVTIASDDEEGVGLFGDDDADEDTDLIMGTDADVDMDDQQALESSTDDMPTDENFRLRNAGLDQTDNEGEPLNEGSTTTDVSGGDLDTSGVGGDDRMESIGEEDEENNTYSLGSESNDNITEGTP